MGIDPDNDWLCYTFDQAVIQFGLWIEAKLSEYHEGKQVWTLEELLQDAPPDVPASKSGSIAQLIALAGNAVDVKD